MKVGIIGCGNISETYFKNQEIYNNFNIISCSDINLDIAKKSAEKFKLKFQTVEDIFSNNEIDLIINLTIPSAHKEIIIKSLMSGKHCFSEKPIATNFTDGKEILHVSKEKNLYVGCAPDTFLGASCQKARSLIDKNRIGKIVLGTFNLISHGMEHWHPNPSFFFKPGAGPVFDVGVYYITQLINLIGPVKSINATSATPIRERVITSQPRYGEKIKVETPTTLMGILEFHNKAKIQFFCSWDIWKNNSSFIELYGLDGSIIMPDPNFFSGDIRISNKDEDWEIINNDDMLLGIPNMIDSEGNKIANYRGIGLSEMIDAINNKRNPRCSLNLSIHVLEIMEGIIKSSQTGEIYNLNTISKQPEYFGDKEILKLKHTN
tara:strand:+ start:3212 stop:4342 length:1131 start_codon:yes stop_codon:yes gene_type:complete